MVHGEELGQTQLGDTRLALVRHAAGQETPRHGHDRACMHIVLRGLYVEHSSAGPVAACPGDVVFKQPEVEHWNHFGSMGAESLRFQLSEPHAQGVDALGSARSAPELERALQLGRGLREGTEAKGTPISLRVSPQAELLTRLRRRFQRRFALSELAAEIGINRSHLTRQFTREFGCSPQAYVALKRAAWAAEQLAVGGETLASIAVAAGFADQSHCIRTFKRAFGTTPARWRRETRW